MLTQEQNDTLTRVGPGTPMGELLRRYWFPLAPQGEVDEVGMRPVRLLGEDLVVFKDGQGRYGLLAEHCSHRSASLCFGLVEQEGIRCPYHGWKYDVEGNILETPPEHNEAIMRSVKHPAYPVQTLAGLLFGYLGPAPAPLLPRYDILVREDWVRRVEIHPALDCNWLQPMENSVDPAHLYWLHGYRGGAPAPQDEHEEFEVFEYGIYKSHYTKERVEVHPLVFPNILRGPGHVIHFRVPMDDTHTRIFYVLAHPTADVGSSSQKDVPYSYIGPIKEAYDDSGVPRYRWRMDPFASQDGMAWETQGPLANRSKEHLGSSDRGVVLLRQMLSEQLEAVEQGRDPLGVIRDPERNRVIELKVQETDRATGEVVPPRGPERRSFASPVTDRTWGMTNGDGDGSKANGQAQAGMKLPKG